MTTHFLINQNRYRCGKRPTQLSGHTTVFPEVTCKVCIESHKYNNGKIREYRLGGSFEKGNIPRKRSNHWDYKKEMEQLNYKLSLALEVIERQQDIISFVANIEDAVEVTADHYWSLEDHANIVGISMDSDLRDIVRKFDTAHDAFCQITKLKSEINKMMEKIK